MSGRTWAVSDIDSDLDQFDPRTEIVMSLTKDQLIYVLTTIALTKNFAFDEAIIALFNHERQLARAMADMFPDNCDPLF